MKALIYLILMKLKNNIKELFRKPAKLIYAIFMVAILVLLIVTNANTTMHESEKISREYLTAGVFAVYTLIFYISIATGFQTGASIFRLPDANHLFTAPFHPRSLLFYGLIQQMGTCLFAGIFLVFQYGWLQNCFGISLWEMTVIIIGYVFVMLLAQLLAMIIYTATNQNENLKKVIKIIAYGPIVLFIAYYVILAIKDDSIGLPLLSQAGNSIYAKRFPVSGWISTAVNGVLLGDSQQILLGCCLALISIICVILLLFIVRMDYYEDVLQTAEASYAAVTAAKEGRIQEAVPRKVKLGKTGLGEGYGASAFYYKHLIENRRGKTYLSTLSIILIVCAIVASYFLRNFNIIPILAFTTYMQMFTVSMGRLPRELLKPFIYLVPENSFRKIMYSLLEAWRGYLFEALLLYIPTGLIMKLSVEEILICIIVRISFSFLYLTGNLLTERIMGSFSSKMMILTFYMLLLLALSAPGIVVGLVLILNDIILIGEIFTVLLSMAVCNTIVALLCIFISRNVLEYAELNN